MNKIIPYNPYFPSYFNAYKKLAQEVVDNAASVVDFLLYFKPNYYILNAPASVIHTSNWREIKQNSLTENELNSIWSYEDGVPYCIPAKLEYRQGYFNPYSTAYCQFKKYNEEIKQWEDDFISFPIASTVLSRQWAHSGTHDYFNNKYNNIDNFIFIAQKTSDGYLMFSDFNGLNFKLQEDFARSVGTNQLLILDLIPTRYFSIQEWEWNSGAVEFAIPNRTINNNKTITSQIINKKQIAWNNAHPLLHEIELYTPVSTGSMTCRCEKIFYDEQTDTAETRNGDIMQTVYYIKHINQQLSIGILPEAKINFY